jgi:hypothetical protein
VPEDTHEVEFETYEESWTGRVVIAAVVALALIGGAFFAGKAIAGGGPSTLAEAVQQAQKGTLPCGDTGTAAAPPAGTPDADGGPPTGGGGFFLRGICDRNGGQGNGSDAGPGGRFGGRGFAGQTVTAVSAESITVDGPNGSTTVKLDADTAVSKSSGASVSEIKKGDSVLVAGGFGQNPSSGAARSITILQRSAGTSGAPLSRVLGGQGVGPARP